MTFVKTTAATALIASSLALGGCVNDGYGYGGVNVGYGSPGYYDNGGYGYGAYGYGYAPYGWYDGYYYPGNGYWLYDRGGHRHRWNDGHRRYWEQRRSHARDWRGPRDQPWRPGIRDDNRGRPDGNRERISRDRPATPQAAPQAQQPQRQPREGVTAPGGASRGDGRGREGRIRRER